MSDIDAVADTPTVKRNPFGEKLYPQGKPLTDCDFLNDYVPEIRDALIAVGISTCADLSWALYSQPDNKASLNAIRNNYTSSFVNGGMLRIPRSVSLPERLPGLIIRLVKQDERFAGFDAIAAYARVLETFAQPVKEKWIAALMAAAQPVVHSGARAEAETKPDHDLPLYPHHEEAHESDAGWEQAAAPFDVSSLSSADLLRRLLLAQKTLAEMGIVASMETRGRAIKAARNLFAGMDPDAREFLEGFLFATGRKPTAVQVGKSSRLVTQAVKPHREARHVSGPATRMKAGRPSKPLTDYSWFQMAWNLPTLEGLRNRESPITTRRELFAEMTPIWVASGRKASDLVLKLTDILKRRSTAGMSKRKVWLARQMESLAGLSARETSPTAAPVHSEPVRAAPIVVRISDETAGTPLPVAVEGPILLDGDLSPEQIRETVLFNNLKTHFLVVQNELMRRNLSSIDAIWRLVPESVRPNRKDFVEMLADLVGTQQPYRVQSLAGSGLKLVATTLSLTFMPGQDAKRLWADCEPITKKTRLPQHFFAELMAEHSSPLFLARQAAGYRSSAGQSGRASEQDVRAALMEKLRSAPEAERNTRVNSYMKFYKAEKGLTNGQNLVSDAVSIMDLLDIPSREVINAIFSLRNELIYSDLVREHFPNLAQLMRNRKLYTVSAIAGEWSRIMLPEMRKTLYDALWDDTPDTLRSEACRPIVEMLGQALRVEPDDILASRKLVYAPRTTVLGPTDATSRMGWSVPSLMRG